MHHLNQEIRLWGVVTPAGEPIVGTLDHTQHAAIYRYGALSIIPPCNRSSFWRDQQAKGYQLQRFILEKEKNNG